MNKTNYEKIINEYYYEKNYDLEKIHEYISKLYLNRRINMNRWFELYCFILNLSDY